MANKNKKLEQNNAHNSKMTEHVKKVMETMANNQSTAQRGNQNAGKGTFPKATHVTPEEFAKKYGKTQEGTKELQ